MTGNKRFEIWSGNSDPPSFSLNYTMELSEMEGVEHVGQSLFIDLELMGEMRLVVPVCRARYCQGSALLVAVHNGTRRRWHDLQLTLRDPHGVEWRWARQESAPHGAVTLRQGDYNMDG